MQNTIKDRFYVVYIEFIKNFMQNMGKDSFYTVYVEFHAKYG